MFSEYREYLNCDFSPNYWHDEGITQAGLMLGKFSPRDWQILSEAWQREAVDWRVRCAQTLDENLPEHGAAILRAMLDDGDRNVVVAAADALRSWPSPFTPDGEIDSERLEQIRDASGPVDGAVLTDFWARSVVAGEN